MSKTALVDEIQDKFNSRAEADRAVDAVTGGIETMLRRHENVAIKGFGTFAAKGRAERKGRNPRDPSQTITIAARTVATFKSKLAL